MRTAKTILTLILLTFPIMVSNAQNEENLATQQPLAGVWQPCGKFEGAPETDPATQKPKVDLTKHVPGIHYKMFGKGGEFCAFTAATPARLIVWATGSYEMVADGKYVEHIGFHSDADVTGRSIEMNYAVLEERLIIVTWE